MTKKIIKRPSEHTSTPSPHKARPERSATAAIRAILDATDGQMINYPAETTILRQGQPADWVYYLGHGKVQISVVSKQGKEGMIGLPLGQGAFLGESSLTSQRFYLVSASCLTKCQVIKIPRAAMADAILKNIGFAHTFAAYLLQHALDIEGELVDHLFNSSEKRLARVLLLLANFGQDGRFEPITDMTQELLAQRVGTTRARISFFMNKFRRLGLIEYNGSIKVHSGLLNVVLHDSRLEGDA